MIVVELWWCEVSSTDARRRWSELRRCSAHARCSAASALLRFSCFFHFVRRFWNHIFTCTIQYMPHWDWTFSVAVHVVQIQFSAKLLLQRKRFRLCIGMCGVRLSARHNRAPYLNHVTDLNTVCMTGTLMGSDHTLCQMGSLTLQ